MMNEQIITHLDGWVTMTKSHYDYMVKRLYWLKALEAAGVDNWEGISEAHSMIDYIYDED